MEHTAEISPEKKMHGWFSKKQKEKMSESFYMLYKNLKPISVIYLNEKGDKVEVTEITHSIDDHGTAWNDMEYRDIVVIYIRGVYPPTELKPV